MVIEGRILSLGAHTVNIAADQKVMIANEVVVIELDREETYRLLVVLQDMFK